MLAFINGLEHERATARYSWATSRGNGGEAC